MQKFEQPTLNVNQTIIKRFPFLITLAFAISSSLSPTMAQGIDPIPQRVHQIHDSIIKRYAPDNRTARLGATFHMVGNTLMVQGTTTSEEIHDALIGALKTTGHEIIDGLKTLPVASVVGEKTWAVVNVSVCNLRTSGAYSAEMASQGLLGMPVKILDIDDWVQIQTPDNYISWVRPNSLRRMTREEVSAWNNAPQVEVTALYGFVYSKPDERSQTVSDVVATNRLRYIGRHKKFYEVEYPDGRRGFLSVKDGKPLDEWRKHLSLTPESIIATGQQLTGIPYMWGAMSTKGVDCSGFVRTVFLMHDITLPRDASQQVLVGERIEPSDDLSNLMPGDLVFFGNKARNGLRERIWHVGIYMGNHRFIHSLGNVHESSFDPQSPIYDKYNHEHLAAAVRILPHLNRDKAISTTSNNSYYK